MIGLFAGSTETAHFLSNSRPNTDGGLNIRSCGRRDNGLHVISRVAQNGSETQSGQGSARQQCGSRSLEARSRCSGEPPMQDVMSRPARQDDRCRSRLDVLFGRQRQQAHRRAAPAGWASRDTPIPAANCREEVAAFASSIDARSAPETRAPYSSKRSITVRLPATGLRYCSSAIMRAVGVLSLL